MMKRILVAIDGSATSWKAFDHAVALAKGTGAEVLGVIHVRPSLMTLSYAYGFDEAAMYHLNLGRRMEQELREGEARSRGLLQEAADRAWKAGLGGAHIVTHAEEGSIVRKILDVVQREGYDLLVLGSRGVGRAAGLLLGSVAQSVVANLPCSVLVVEAKDEAEAEDAAEAEAAG